MTESAEETKRQPTLRNRKKRFQVEDKNAE